jgi:hypothetical protein
MLSGCASSPAVPDPPRLELLELKPPRALLQPPALPALPRIPDDDARALTILLEHDLQATAAAQACVDQLGAIDQLYWPGP